MDNLWALGHPSPTPDIAALLALPPIAGWVCMPMAEFAAETKALTEATLGLAQYHLRWEREEGNVRLQATSGPTLHQVTKRSERSK